MRSVPTRAAILLLALACGGVEPWTAPQQSAAQAGPQASQPGPGQGANRTRHPIILAHGWSGWDEALGVSYFFRVRDALVAEGFEVYATEVNPYGTIAERAGQLARQIDRWVPGRRVNIVGHSMGGLDGRYLISRLGWGERVASLTTISTPHHGTSVADVGLGLAPGPLWDALEVLVHGVGYTVDSARQLTRAYLEGEFNPRTPDNPRVQYSSWAGVADPLATTGDLLNPALDTGWAVLADREGPNDGLCSEASARWGDYRGRIPADHLEEIGQPVGLVTFDYVGFYRTVAEDLEARGL